MTHQYKKAVAKKKKVSGIAGKLQDWFSAYIDKQKKGKRVTAKTIESRAHLIKRNRLHPKPKPKNPFIIDFGGR